MLSRNNLRRFTEHKPYGKPLVLSEDHPAAINSTSLFSKGAVSNRASGRVLISGHNSRKIGKRVIKGKWAGFPIYTLTLEERATCPRSCEQWHSCYGNKMHWSIRQKAGEELENKIEQELRELQVKHSQGFVVRLHVLGDFYSTEYVEKWQGWLKQFLSLHVFGYTARMSTDPIGKAIALATQKNWERFAIRSSGALLKNIPSAIVVTEPQEGAIICPAQTGGTDCCGTCGLCWSTEKTIAFMEH